MLEIREISLIAVEIRCIPGTSISTKATPEAIEIQVNKALMSRVPPVAKLFWLNSRTEFTKATPGTRSIITPRIIKDSSLPKPSTMRRLLSSAVSILPKIVPRTLDLI